MHIPVDSEAFLTFIRQSGLFARTKETMWACLENWYRDEPEDFREDMRADLETVRRTYRFRESKVTLDKNFWYDPPMDTVTCYIDIEDDEGDHCADYRAIYDENLEIIDDALSK